MAGTVFISDKPLWSDKSSVFYWVVDTLAERVRDVELAEQLREISQHNLGSLSLHRFTADQQSELLELIGSLPQAARAELPDTPGREAIALRLTELARLATSAERADHDESDSPHGSNRREADIGPENQEHP